MVDTFSYRPKFVDIRVKKPAAGAREPIAEERPCDHIGCRLAGAHRAPKSKTGGPAYWWFCTTHAAEYNRRWNFFEGMTEAELAAFEEAERAGHRPTWTFKAAKNDRLSSAAQRGFAPGRRNDAFGVLGGEADARRARKPRLGRLQVLALEVLGLDETAAPEAVRARYAELVKRYHPDANGGDRTDEAMLHKVIRAYQTLKSGGMG